MKPEDRCIALNNGKKMPIIGIGTWTGNEIAPEEIENAVSVALDIGYRHVDTAFLYQNEHGVGKAVKSWTAKGNKREDVFVVTKLPMIAMRPTDVEKFLRKSLKNLGMEYVDLFLVHTPVGYVCHPNQNLFPLEKGEEGFIDIDYATDLIAIWKEMENMVDKGLTKSVGISNFNLKQVELHAEFQQEDLRKGCESLGVQVTSYGSIGSPGRKNFTVLNMTVPDLINNPVILLIAKKHNKTAAQVLLKYLVQMDIVVIPKSVHVRRIKENFDIWDFDLDEVDMSALKSLDKGEDGRSFDFFRQLGQDRHPECPF